MLVPRKASHETRDEASTPESQGRGKARGAEDLFDTNALLPKVLKAWGLCHAERQVWGCLLLRVFWLGFDMVDEVG